MTKRIKRKYKMAVSQNALSKILSNARALCSPEGDKMVNEYKVTGYDRDYFDNPDPNSFVENYSDYGEVVSEDEKSVLAKSAPVISENKLRNSGIPSAIRESFARKQIDTSKLSNVSVLDQMSTEAKQRIAGSIRTEKKNSPRTAINEQTNRAQQPVGVDYTAMKAIIKECIEEYFEKHPINESANLKTIALQQGKINLVDNKGRLFSAKLVLEGNVNDGEQGQ